MGSVFCGDRTGVMPDCRIAEGAVRDVDCCQLPARSHIVQREVNAFRILRHITRYQKPFTADEQTIGRIVCGVPESRDR